jgi:glyoxylase-like metal-dependent hydrolase (beta-lactamase superfamily II)
VRIHHLNCGSICPLIGGPAVAHCLLVETARSGLVLVDTGIGRAMCESPKQGMSLVNRVLLRPRFDVGETAHAQVLGLGYRTADVRHVVVTHLDIDHAGGLPDFPQAELHVCQTELALAESGRDPRYDRRLLLDTPVRRTYEAAGERLFGLRTTGRLSGIDEDLALVALPGHTAGHSGVALRRRDGSWLLHAGDAFLMEEELFRPGRVPLGTRLGAWVTAMDWKARSQNLERLRELARGSEVDVISSHCIRQYGSRRSALAHSGGLSAAGVKAGGGGGS